MIPLFVGYAVIVWYLAARYRRTLLAYACAMSGVVLLVTLGYAHWVVGRFHPELFIQGMQILLYPYTIVVGAVGVFIASMPRRAEPGCCPSCGYNLLGLESPKATCPECGGPCETDRVRYRPSGTERGDLRAPDVSRVSAADPADGRPGQQHQPGHDTQQDPADR